MTNPKVPTLREFLDERSFPNEAAAVLTGLDQSAISRIANGRRRARPATIVRLARGLGVSARRMQLMCEASWANAHASGVDEVQR